MADFAYAYDTLSNLTARVDANESLAESFAYDSLNRVTEYTIAGGATKTVSYDDLCNITFKSDVGSYSYNASGSTSVRPHAVAAIVPGGSGLVNTSYAYDDNGNMTAGNGRATTFGPPHGSGRSPLERLHRSLSSACDGSRLTLQQGRDDHAGHGQCRLRLQWRAIPGNSGDTIPNSSSRPTSRMRWRTSPAPMTRSRT
ncbi:MAG: hypothetical protein CVT83_01990 [Alphaproteobacteria bacterium HGW-Alphaproteobacteria-5]|nr:MAG: hypothetical protein CVT83_01990 [Alphaproteobacteria bacterium HGW-Alphaproteobacteria-5]